MVKLFILLAMFQYGDTNRMHIKTVIYDTQEKCENVIADEIQYEAKLKEASKVIKNIVRFKLIEGSLSCNSVTQKRIIKHLPHHKKRKDLRSMI